MQVSQPEKVDSATCCVTILLEIWQKFDLSFTTSLGSMDIETENGIKKKAKFGTADFLIDLENRRSIKVS